MCCAVHEVCATSTVRRKDVRVYDMYDTHVSCVPEVLAGLCLLTMIVPGSSLAPTRQIPSSSRALYRGHRGSCNGRHTIDRQSDEQKRDTSREEVLPLHRVKLRRLPPGWLFRQVRLSTGVALVASKKATHDYSGDLLRPKKNGLGFRLTDAPPPPMLPYPPFHPPR